MELAFKKKGNRIYLMGVVDEGLVLRRGFASLYINDVFIKKVYVEGFATPIVESSKRLVTVLSHMELLPTDQVVLEFT